jgi:hypothetical protein
MAHPDDADAQGNCNVCGHALTEPFVRLKKEFRRHRGFPGCDGTRGRFRPVPPPPPVPLTNPPPA